ncbi:hypothetical protein Ahy_B01g053537 [Arachis hypogaea]|uniref:Uncharacterized protein n=1 Tax=Arachis hypogaea TaxID=3818 RepID=A0A445ARX9_ARAHY|nr:hypothetical protein Ahy_B01g053537 [Arachis hypogaea]
MSMLVLHWLGQANSMKICHKWLTIDAYNDTYAFHINPIPSQKLWEKSIYNKPQALKFKMLGAPKKKRRKDADKGPVGGKKQKIAKMKRVLAVIVVVRVTTRGIEPRRRLTMRLLQQLLCNPNVSNAPPPPTVPISNTPPPPIARIDPMVGASAATTSRLRNILRFVPTPGFKPPRNEHLAIFY